MDQTTSLKVETVNVNIDKADRLVVHTDIKPLDRFTLAVVYLIGSVAMIAGAIDFVVWTYRSLMK